MEEVKFVQISTVYATDYEETMIMALDQNGRIWFRGHSDDDRWKEIPLPHEEE